MRVIAFFSQISDSGKTIACVNLAVALAYLGRRVLVIDLDSQADASLAFGVAAPFEDSIGAALLAEHPISAIIQPTLVECVSLAPASVELSRLDEMNSIRDADRTNADGRLQDIALWLELKSVKGVFDEVLLDCPAQHLFANRLALLASTDVVMPINVSTSHLHATTPDLQLVLMAQEISGGHRPIFNGFLPVHTQARGNWRAQHGEADQYDMPHFSLIPFTPDLRQSKLLPASESIQPTTAAFRQVARELTYGTTEARRRATQLDIAPRSLTPPSQRLSALSAYH